VKRLRKECHQSFKKLRDESEIGDKYSRKIVDRIRLKELYKAISSLENPKGTKEGI
jgi:hypothetical protein